LFIPVSWVIEDRRLRGTNERFVARGEGALVFQALFCPRKRRSAITRETVEIRHLLPSAHEDEFS
jgi:hypothetical protein